MEQATINRMLETANKLAQGDSIQRTIAGRYYEQLRQYCRANPTDETTHRALPRGYQLIPH